MAQAKKVKVDEDVKDESKNSKDTSSGGAKDVGEVQEIEGEKQDVHVEAHLDRDPNDPRKVETVDGNTQSDVDINKPVKE